MAAHDTDTPSKDPVTAARPVSVILMSRCSLDDGRAAQPASIHRHEFDPEGRAVNRHGQRRTSESRDGIRSAAATMGWLAWILLALLTAAFLAFAPALVQAAYG